MKAIVAIDQLWGIGKDGDLLFHIKEDMAFFRRMTTGKVVVMGRKTLESLPNGEPLKNRINLVITSNKSYKSHDNVVYGDIDKINEEIKKYDTNDIFIIGGASIYKQFIHRCDTIYVTHNSKIYKADTYMPNLAFEGFMPKQIIDNGDNWCIEEWVTSESTPYKSVLWYFDNSNNLLFLYADCFDKWKGIYSDKEYKPTVKFKERLMSILEDNEKIVTAEQIHDYYKSEINYKQDGCVLRILSYGPTEQEATQNLMMIIVNLLI